MRVSPSGRRRLPGALPIQVGRRLHSSGEAHPQQAKALAREAEEGQRLYLERTKPCGAEAAEDLQGLPAEGPTSHPDQVQEREV